MLIQRAATGMLPPPGFATPPWEALAAQWDAAPLPLTETVQLGPCTQYQPWRSKNTRWTTDLEIHLDRKREEMEHCETDQQLLDWAMREVFGESQRYEELARQAKSQPSSACVICSW